MDEKKLLVYIPAFNEEENIGSVIKSIPKVINGIASIGVLVVDDGSTDRTAEIARSNGATVVRHSRNQGVGAAFQSAVAFAWGHGTDVLVGIDADGQFDPDEIPMLMKPILAGEAEMVIGNRFHSGKPKHMPRIKFWGNRMVAKLISWVSGEKFTDVSCGFRAYSRLALLHLNLFGKFTYTHETILSLAYKGFRVADLPIAIRYFPERKSRVAGSIGKYAVKTTTIILRVLLDYKPLRMFGVFGLLLLLIGTGFEVFLFTFYAINGSFTPYKSAGFIGLGFITFGLLVLLLAMLADMLNRLRLNQDRILVELKKRDMAAGTDSTNKVE